MNDHYLGLDQTTLEYRRSLKAKIFKTKKQIDESKRMASLDARKLALFEGTLQGLVWALQELDNLRA